MSVLVGIVVGVVTAWFLRIAGRDMLQLPALQRTNYRGVPLPTAGGIVIVLTVLVIEAGRAIAGAAGLGDEPGLTLSRSLVLFAAFGFGFLGFVDDLLGVERGPGLPRPRARPEPRVASRPDSSSCSVGRASRSCSSRRRASRAGGDSSSTRS